MLDVDDFKIVNDTLGHNVGDRVLSQTGQVLKEAVGANGIVGRLGGDEFAAIVFGLEDSDAVDEFCVKLSDRLKNIIFDMEYSASIGMTTGDDRELTFRICTMRRIRLCITQRGRERIAYRFSILSGKMI